MSDDTPTQGQGQSDQTGGATSEPATKPTLNLAPHTASLKPDRIVVPEVPRPDTKANE